LIGWRRARCRAIITRAAKAREAASITALRAKPTPVSRLGASASVVLSAPAMNVARLTRIQNEK